MSKFVRFWLMPLLGAAQLAVAGGTYRAPSFSLPLAFEPGTEPGRFVARGRNYQFQLSHGEIDLLLVSQTNNSKATAHLNSQPPLSRLDQALLRRANDVAAGSPRIVSMRFVGANPDAQLTGRVPMQGKVNYLVGNRPEAWRTGIPCFSSVGIERLYSGVNLVCYGNQRSLEYDLDLAPGADLSQVSLRIEGADRVSIGKAGELVLSIGSEQIEQPVPAVYQMAGSQRHFLQGNYYLKDAHTVGFEVANYDRTQPLVVDPTLNYSSYFGGNGNDIAWSAKVDAAGNTYVAGQTLSIQFPFSLPGGGYQTTNIGSIINGSAFIAKFDPTLTNLLYFTYLGGYGDNAALDLELDGAGHAYVAGYTDATNFPIFNAVQPTIKGYVTPAHAYASDAFVAELNGSGSDLIFSTYYGGNDLDSALGIALDSSTNVYITGFTYSSDFPVVNPLPGEGTIHGSNDVFVVKLSPMGSNVIYATYLGGADFDVGQGIAADGAGNAYVTGYTSSTNFPTLNELYVSNSIPAQINASTNSTHEYQGKFIPYDAFVAKIGTYGTNLFYSTYLGGSQSDSGFRIKVDSGGDAYIVGASYSPDFPGPLMLHGLTSLTNLAIPHSDAFLCRLTTDTNGRAMVRYSVLMGSILEDVAWDIALDPVTTNIFICGSTLSTNFPLLNSRIPFLQTTNQTRSNDVFVAAFTNSIGPVLRSDGSLTTNAVPELLYSVVLGGLRSDFGYGIAIDAAENAVVVGQTLSADFPTINPLQSALVGQSDAFIARIFPTNSLVAVTLDTSPAGLSVVADGTNYVTPVVFTNWVAGSQHTIAPVTPQAGATNVQYAWTSWSDGGFLSHIVVPTEDETITANFKTQYFLGISTTNLTVGAVGGGVTSPGSGFYDAGSSVTLTATPANGDSFAGWSGTGSGSFTGSTNPATVVMSGPVFEMAQFTGPLNNNLTLLISGSGKVTPNDDGKALTAGKTYRFQAIPGKGYVFAGWSGSTNTNNAVLQFVMQPGSVLEASFIPSPFIGIKGNYSGLFYDPSGLASESSGLFTASVTDAGTFSARVVIQGRSRSFSGYFNNDGTTTYVLSRPFPQNPLIITLELDLVNHTGLFGQISDTIWVANLASFRPAYSKSNPAPEGGKKYTLSLTGSAVPLGAPGGYSPATLSVDLLGNLRLAGTLADGTRITESTFINAGGTWPLYVPLYYAKLGSVLGWLTFTNEPATDLAGTVVWSKPGLPRDRLYPGGFLFQAPVMGSQYQVTNGVPPLAFSQIVFQDAGLAQPLTNQVNVDAKGRVKITGGPKTTFNLNSGSGTFQGSLVNPTTRRVLPFSGVLLQKADLGAGFLLNTNQSGTVLLLP